VVNRELWLRFLSGPDIDALGLSNAEIVAAVEGAVRAHGEGCVVVEPRVHLVPDNGGAGHFNVQRASARIHRLMDPAVTGLNAQLAHEPGPTPGWRRCTSGPPARFTPCGLWLRPRQSA
jgi:ornithine cyclodeaminase